ncbi:MAG: hypothetical protein HN548_02765 [Opitutae bacterium]|jgi:WD40 repeat protein|nr:hypothetical protein [Opitutae bacterium]MBT5716867.1 hypothetical protein [Opitutae bacterium]
MKIYFLLIAFISISWNGLYATPEKPNLEDDIMPIFESKCNSCHNPDRARGGLDLNNMNGILAGGSSGESVVSGDGENSYLYKLIARIEKPYMPQKEDKMPQAEIDLVKKWIDLGLLPTATGKPIQKKKSSVNLALGNVSIGKPDGPPPMPKYLSLEPSVVTKRAFAPSAMASAPWSPLVAIAGQKQVLLYNTETLKLMGVLPYPEGFIESLTFSRNGKLIVAGGGRGGKSGRVAGWDVKSGNRLLTVGEEYDSILTADISPDQSLLVIGSPSKLIKVYDIATDELLYEIKKHSEWVTQVAFSPDGILLATADRNGGLYIWEAETGNPFYTLDGHKEAITDISWRADSNLLVSTSEEGSVRTWEMINGKQVKTWNAHPAGALSVQFDKEGNIITGGRDKTVKLWKGDGKAVRTIKEFSDIVMEVCYSHDGKLAVVGDWTGNVSVWNVTDGKKIGQLTANPPELTARVETAQETVNETKQNLELARSRYKPLSEGLNKLKVSLANDQKILHQAEQTMQVTTNALAVTKKASELANELNKQKIKEKTEREKELNDKKAKISQNKLRLAQEKKAADYWKKHLEDRTTQLSVLKEAHRKAQEQFAQNKDDSNQSKIVTDKNVAMKAMEVSVIEARNLFNKHKSESDNLNNLSLELNKQLQDNHQNFASATLAMKAALEDQKKKELNFINTSKTLNLEKKFITEASNKLNLSQKSLDKALSEIQKPKEEIVHLEKKLIEAQKQHAHWKAEIFNVARHIELRNLRSLKSELNEMEILLAEAQELKNSALLAFQNATSSMNELPEKIKENKHHLSQKKIDVIEAEKRKVSVIQLREEKNQFIKNVTNLASIAQNKSQAKEPDSTFGKASIKFQETISLLKKDLIETENQLATKEQELLHAKETVLQAEKNLQSTINLLNSTPLLIKEKDKLLSDAKANETKRQKEFDLFNTKTDQQSVKAKILFEKYIDLLPAN